MANVIIDDKNLKDIADAIREKSSSTDKYKPNQMAAAISDISAGEDKVKAQLEAQRDWGYFCYGGRRKEIIEDNPEITKNGTIFSYMFNSDEGDTTIPYFNTSNGADFSYMFASSVFETIPLIDTSKGINFISMFANNDSLVSIPALDFSSGTTFTNTFQNCISLTTVPVLNMPKATAIGNMFYNCSGLENFPTFAEDSFHKCSTLTNTFNGSGIRNVSNFIVGYTSFTSTISALNCFANCEYLETVDTIKILTKSNTTATTMFQNCSSLTYIKHLEIPKFHVGANLFKDCSALTTIDYLDIGSANTGATATTYNNIFNGCESLTTINSLKTGMFNTNMFQGCPNLTTCILTNELRVKTSNALNLSYCPNLTVESLMSFVNNITENTATTKYNIVFGETNLAKLTEEQKQILIDKNYNLI